MDKEVVQPRYDTPGGIMTRQGLSYSRAFWTFLFYLIANRLPDTPMPFGRLGNGVRVFVARRFFMRVGKNANVHSGVDVGSGRSLVLGNHSSINRRCWIANDTVIGDHVMMGPDVAILSGSHNFCRTDVPMNRQGAPDRRPVTIGNDIWIGTRAIILPGVTIGDHSIIGAGAVVTKDVAPWSIVAGNPARPVGDRRDEVMENAAGEATPTNP